jgi:hypothetical protein
LYDANVVVPSTDDDPFTITLLVALITGKENTLTFELIVALEQPPTVGVIAYRTFPSAVVVVVNTCLISDAGDALLEEPPASVAVAVHV